MLCRRLDSPSIVVAFLLDRESVVGRMLDLLLQILRRIGLLVILGLW